MPTGSFQLSALLVFAAVLVVLFLIFKVFHLSIKVFIKLLINALIGAVILFIFNFVFAGLLNISALAIPITWWSALVTGIFGVPGVIVLLIISLIL